MSDDKSSWLRDALGFVADKAGDAAAAASAGASAVAGAAATVVTAEVNALGAVDDAASGIAKRVGAVASGALKTIEGEADDLRKKAGEVWDEARTKVAGAAGAEEAAISGAAAAQLHSIGLAVQNVGACAHDYLTLADAVGRCVEALGATPNQLLPQITTAAKSHNLASIPAILLSSQGIQTLAGVSTAVTPLVDCLNGSDAQGNKSEIATLSKLKHDIDAVIKFLQAASGAQAAPSPAGAGTAVASGSAAADTGSLGQMGRDCKIVRGRVPGPRNHVLCGTHHHILDETAKTVIAKDLDDYKHRYAKHAASGTAPSGGAAAHASPAPAASGQERMTAACKPIHGKVPGPRNHVLCGTHHHILDTDAGTIIAKDLAEYKQRYVGGAKPAATPPGAGVDIPLNMTRPRDPMQQDCVAVHGKVPGPAHHLLCRTHGHVLDIKAKTIIADSLDEYKQQFK